MARDYQTKSNSSGLPDSITATRFGGGEFNSIATELENAVTTSGQTLAPADGTGEVTDQLAMALAIYGAGGAFYHADTGAVNAYVLTPISPKESPPAYFDGFTVIFEPGTANTTASTVNVNSLGVKDITYSDGNALVGGELSGSCGIKYNLSDDRFELLFSSGALAGLSPVYVIDASQADQGAASSNPNTYTVFDAAAAIGTTKNATIYFTHNPIAGNQTLYTFDTSLDLSTYNNIFYKFDPGAQLDRTTGDEVLSVRTPEHFIAGERQKITADDMLAFYLGGTLYPEWWGAVGNGSTDSTNAIQYAMNAASAAGASKVFINEGVYRCTDTITFDTDTYIHGLGISESRLYFVGLSATTDNGLEPLNKTTARTDYVTIKDIDIQGDATTLASAGYGLELRNVWSSHIERVRVQNFSLGAARLWSDFSGGSPTVGESARNTFIACQFFYGSSAFTISGTTDTPRSDSGTCALNTFFGCRFAGGDNHGLLLNSGYGNSFFGCHFQANGADGIRIGWWNNYFYGCHCENNTSYGVNFLNNTETWGNCYIGNGASSNTLGDYSDTGDLNTYMMSGGAGQSGFKLGNLDTDNTAIGAIYRDADLLMFNASSDNTGVVVTSYWSTESTDFNVLITDHGKRFLIGSGGGDVTASLPAASGLPLGFRVGFKKSVAANNMIIAPNGTDTIDGVNSSISYAADETFVQLEKSSTNGFSITGYYP